MVPVLDSQKQPLMPCSEKRARLLMDRGSAKPFWQKGIFCIRLTRKPSVRNRQPIVLGIDPGSKREGYTVATEKAVVLNITTNTPDWVKDAVETRRNLRRARRYRKTPYRPCRSNRSSLRNGRVPPSTRARWLAKLRVIRFLMKILSITIVNVEDIKATTKAGKDRRNKSFSPLEVGKSWFYREVEQLDVMLIKTEGYKTFAVREARGFSKSKGKLDYVWEAHNVDSHVLCEIALKKELVHYNGLWMLEFLKYSRRQLHVQNPARGNVRKQYGGTVSMGMSRGSALLYKDKLYYLGGSSNGRVAVHSIVSGKRVKQHTKVQDIKIMYNNKWRAQFLPRLKAWEELRNFG